VLNLLTSLAATAIILGKDEQIQLVREAQDTADNAARHSLVQANIRLAHKIAKKHIRKGLDFNDLLSCATEGILIAIDKFDATKKASFTTYARMWMIAKCQEHVQANAGLVHCGSRTSKKLWSGLQKARKAIGVDATPDELAAHMGLNVEDVNACLMYMHARGASLDAPLSDDGGTIATVIGDGKMGQDERLERTANSEHIRKTVATFILSLNERQRAIFKGRVVNELLGNDKQCATTFGVTKQRVGQIEKDLRGRLARHFTATLGADGVNDMLRASF
jgi:RNA polymerase sigma factor (sigma-70 family)